jgi:dienelactone hydrolase
VDIEGPENLVTLLTPAEPSPRSNLEATAMLIGDPRTEEGRTMLAERSPVHAAGNIKRPLLIVQGGNDPRVPQAESDQMVAAMVGRGLPVTYVVFPDEGHGLVRPGNNLAFHAVAESFLADCLGGRAEPVADAFTNSSIIVPEGAEHVPGLRDALSNHQRAMARGD